MLFSRIQALVNIGQTLIWNDDNDPSSQTDIDDLVQDCQHIGVTAVMN